jgi:DnaJ-class molecular chaperone
VSGGKRDPRGAIARFVERAHEALASTDYYGILGVARDTNAVQMRDVYYKLAAKLHPDLHAGWMNEEQRRKLTSVYSRVVEAYKILSDGQRRAQYDAGLAEGKLRFDADAAARPKIKRVEDDVPDGSARKFFLLGCDALRSRNGKGAVMNLRMALSMAPGNEVIKRELEVAEKLAASQESGG